jgi:aerobic-type carbon monoxide dehydrogenase small subunit (CoxS/CutS family)
VKYTIPFKVNGEEVEVVAKASTTLAEVLREQLGLTGTKFTCQEGDCGSCTVLVDGEPRRSCLILAPAIRNKEVTTIEGLGTPQKPHPLQRAFVDNFAIQCGFCTPGAIISAKALLDEKPDPTEQDVRLALSGNLCRCTGYYGQIRAVLAAAKEMAQEVKK